MRSDEDDDDIEDDAMIININKEFIEGFTLLFYTVYFHDTKRAQTYIIMTNKINQLLERLR